MKEPGHIAEIARLAAGVVSGQHLGLLSASRQGGPCDVLRWVGICWAPTSPIGSHHRHPVRGGGETLSLPDGHGLRLAARALQTLDLAAHTAARGVIRIRASACMSGSSFC